MIDLCLAATERSAFSLRALLNHLQAWQHSPWRAQSGELRRRLTPCAMMAMAVHCSATTCIHCATNEPRLDSFSSAHHSSEALPASPAICCTCAPTFRPVLFFAVQAFLPVKHSAINGSLLLCRVHARAAPAVRPQPATAKQVHQPSGCTCGQSPFRSLLPPCETRLHVIVHQRAPPCSC